jgi:photosystem II stability/assembly factor-like uncharacterized protein
VRRGALVAALALCLLAGAPGGAQQGRIITTLTLFAGTAEGLWRTTNWGSSWERVESRISGDHLDALGAARAIRPVGPRVWVAGDGGLYSSVDFGETWQLLSSTPGITSLLLSHWPDADPTVFVGTGSGLFRSRDGGRSFTPTALPAGAVRRLEWPGPALVVACDGGLLTTGDEGTHFLGPGSGLPPGGVVAMALSSFFSLDPVLFAAPVSGGVYLSSDGGKSWRAAGLAGERVFDLVWLGPFLYAAGETGFFRSQDMGASWTRLSASPGRPNRLMFPLAPAAGVEAFLATDRGVFHTGDAGEHWEPSGFAGKEVLEIATFPPPDPVTKGKPRR